jgi:hypothetical protein
MLRHGQQKIVIPAGVGTTKIGAFLSSSTHLVRLGLITGNPE